MRRLNWLSRFWFFAAVTLMASCSADLNPQPELPNNNGEGTGGSPMAGTGGRSYVASTGGFYSTGGAIATGGATLSVGGAGATGGAGSVGGSSSYGGSSSTGSSTGGTGADGGLLEDAGFDCSADASIDAGAGASDASCIPLSSGHD